MNISFGGATIKRPGSYSTVDTASMTPITTGSFNVLSFIGVPMSGATIPSGKVSYFNNPTDAETQIGASELLDCLKIAWSHGADLIAVAPIFPAGAQPTDTEWQSAIDLLNVEFVDALIPVTSTATIHAKVDLHITTQSNVLNRKERRAFYGHAAGETTTAITARQTGLPNELGVMATPAPYVIDSTGAKVLKPSYYLASAYAGLWAADPSQALTYQYVKFPGLEVSYDATAIGTLLDGHVAPTEVVRNKGLRIVQGVTMVAVATTDLTKVELSVSSNKTTMNRTIREYFEDKYVGKAGVDGILVTLYNDLITQIEGFKKNGLITSYKPESVRITQNGTAFTYEWEGKPTLPINNFLIKSHFTL